MKRICVNIYLIFIWLFLLPPGCIHADQSAFHNPDSRPAHWARPMEISGLPNFHQVSPVLYRSAQPSAEGFAELKKMGVRTVVNLRSFHSDAELLKDTGLHYESIPANTWELKEEDAVRFLKIVTDPDKTPVLVHCQHGADRTGTMVAVYRILLCGWTKEEALKEMTEGGFGFHSVWKNLIHFVENLDTESIRKQAGISRTASENICPLPGK
ncbi:MAG: dual specificity protein phosphatase family protein [Desulfobacterales bacterium]